MRGRKLRALLSALTALVLLQASGCTTWWNAESDAVRTAVIAHQLDEQGISVDDLIIRLSPSEFRSDFGHGSRMVWLVSNTLERRYREGEYFKLRDPRRSYLFVEDVRYEDSQRRAMVRVVLQLVGQQPIASELTLRKTGVVWGVVSETQVD